MLDSNQKKALTELSTKFKKAAQKIAEIGLPSLNHWEPGSKPEDFILKQPVDKIRQVYQEWLADQNKTSLYPDAGFDFPERYRKGEAPDPSSIHYIQLYILGYNSDINALFPVLNTAIPEKAIEALNKFLLSQLQEVIIKQTAPFKFTAEDVAVYERFDLEEVGGWRKLKKRKEKE